PPLDAGFGSCYICRTLTRCPMELRAIDGGEVQRPATNISSTHELLRVVQLYGQSQRPTAATQVEDPLMVRQPRIVRRRDGSKQRPWRVTQARYVIIRGGLLRPQASVRIRREQELAAKARCIAICITEQVWEGIRADIHPQLQLIRTAGQGGDQAGVDGAPGEVSADELLPPRPGCWFSQDEELHQFGCACGACGVALAIVADRAQRAGWVGKVEGAKASLAQDVLEQGGAESAFTGNGEQATEGLAGGLGGQLHAGRVGCHCGVCLLVSVVVGGTGSACRH